MSEMNDLYQDLILDHGRKPRHQGVLPNATHLMRGDNPLCGDKLVLYVEVEDDCVKKASFTGEGCAISMAATSLMVEACLGKTLAEVDVIYKSFHQMLTTNEESCADQSKLGKLQAFSGVAQYPMRVKCATLCWHTLDAALHGHDDVVVSTEKEA